MYMKKMRNVEMMTTEIRKKEEIVNIIERKMQDEKGAEKKKLVKRYSTDLETINEKIEIKPVNSGPHFDALQKEIEGLKTKENQLNQEIHEKDRTIAVYGELLSNLRKKIMEKYWRIQILKN